MFSNLPEKKYYSISEVATHFNVNTSLLRFWEKEFKEINPMIKSSGIRKYTKENIESIRLIYTLLKKDGLTIQGAKKKLKSKDLSEDENLAILKKLNKIKEELNFFSIGFLENVYKDLLYTAVDYSKMQTEDT